MERQMDALGRIVLPAGYRKQKIFKREMFSAWMSKRENW